MKTIDARGIDCPKPVIMTKNELDQMEEGQTLTIADNEVCVKNLEKFAKGQGYGFSVSTREDGNFDVTITKEKGQGQGSEEEVAKQDGSLTIAFASDTMGQGEDELGAILIKSFIYTVSQTQPYPKSMVFFNRGVRLTTEGSPVIDDLKALAEQGVEIVSCGTCLDFYHLKDKLLVGEISNMYDIYERLEKPAKNIVIR